MKHKVAFDLEFKRNPYKGKLIVFEGIDGSGKSTHVNILNNELKKRKIKTFLTKNPTDHSIGKFIRKVLSGKEKIPAEARQYLFCADRVVQQEEIIERLKIGQTVISDRYFWSSVAYGMADINKKDERLITAYSILSSYHQFILPDHTIFLKTDVDTAIKRLSVKEHKEIYENKDFIIKAKENYDFILDKFPKEFTVINSEKHINTVSENILNKVTKYLSAY